MEKRGGGLTLDPKLFHGGGLKRKHAMNSGSGDGSFEFPISISCREAAPASSNEEKRGAVVSEVDFFSSEKKSRQAPEATDLDLKIKQEDLAINTGLQLANAGSDQSTVDEGLSPNEEDKEGKIELATMQEKLGRMTEENRRLKAMLNQVTSNYNSLQMHFMALIQKRSQQNNLQAQEIANDGKKNENRGSIVPRQFIDLGRAADAADEPSQCSTDGGSGDQSSSPAKNGSRKEIVPLRIAGNSGGGRSGFVRDESPENSSQGWAPNDQPKLGLGSEAPDQAHESTMRKARVSVRARSEAPMVISEILMQLIISACAEKLKRTSGYDLVRRLPTAANGANTGRRWQRGTHALALTTAAPWPPAAPFASRFNVARRTAPS
ncbi:putative WRKY transcription factor 42 [Apostasia shenzhenica]|uniref:Putative WRKY transcription factor 42 n=1 Tax=Apostasia shenzhenica TaxID=1088818 RepID=A0A2I0AU85_9ASPA|nr:putative WRKY transcription factor 42 [Apostasia shenzhenica]